MAAFVSRYSHSLMFRLIFLLVTLGGLIVAVLLVSWLVFQTIEESMDSLKAERMPELRGSIDVVAATDATRGLLTSSLAATSSEELNEQSIDAGDIFSKFRTAIAKLPKNERAIMMPALEKAENAVSRLLKARTREFAELDRMADVILSASADATAASKLIEEANDNAIFEMTLSGEDTIATIDDTLTRLVEEDFEQFQTVLSMRGEINLITGLAIAYTDGSQFQIRSIIGDLAHSGLDRLTQLVDQNQEVPAFEAVVPELRRALDTFERVFNGGNMAPNSSDVLEARLIVDAVLSPALDDIYFNFVIANDEAKETNKTALTRLLEEEVSGVRQNAGLDAATKHFFALLLQLSTAQSDAELDLKQRELASQAQDVMRLKSETNFENQPNLAKLLKLADPKTGFSVQRLAVLKAQSTALDASQEATRAVDAIAQETSRFSETALTKIELAAKFLGDTIVGARSRLFQIACLAIAVMMVVPILLWYYVTRPIRNVTAVTERLANGDLSEITGLTINNGELGRMSAALHIFRDNALKAIKMQEEERARELKLAAAAEQRQRAEIAERTERIEEQTRIVKTLAKGLGDLAAGDLSSAIQDEFPEGYAALRLDFNTAIHKLSQIVTKLKGSSKTIENSCSEIASASEDLASRTESNSSTLARTVSAVSDLSTSVAEAAANAGKANAKIRNVCEQVKLNSDVMTDAKSAIDRIETTSGRITSIVDIINSIAFQTNLLALNASVEAARAGDAGQGFAVVANEVRSLAQRCSKAASEISEVVEESRGTVREGVSLADNANNAMIAINDGIDQISKIVDDIASSAEKQAGGLENVNQSIQKLDESTQQNAAMFEETSAANQLLSSEAKALSEVVNSFQLDESNLTSETLSSGKIAS